VADDERRRLHRLRDRSSSAGSADRRPLGRPIVVVTHPRSGAIGRWAAAADAV